MELIRIGFAINSPFDSDHLISVDAERTNNISTRTNDTNTIPMR